LLAPLAKDARPARLLDLSKMSLGVAVECGAALDHLGDGKAWSTLRREKWLSQLA
jgi:hypothetical protein